MLSSVFDMASSSPPTTLNLTLDLNSQAHTPAAGVLKTLDLVAGAPRDFDLHLRVTYGTSVFNFTFTGLEEHHAVAVEGDSNLECSTTTPETYAHNDVEDETLEIDGHMEFSLDSESADSLASDESIHTRKRQRRKPLHHTAVENESYEETEPEDDSTDKLRERCKLRKRRPAPGAYIEPPGDAHDLLDFEDDRSERRPDFRSKNPRASKKRQKSLASFRLGTEPQHHVRRTPDLYMGLDSNDNLEETLPRSKTSLRRSRKTELSRSPRRDPCATQ